MNTWKVAGLAGALLGGMVAGWAGSHHHDDIFLIIDKGRIVTGVYEHDDFEPRRVFGAEFGLDPKNPFFTDDPGFDCAPGTFPFPSNVGFDIITELLLWNGDGFDPTAGERMKISHDTRSRLSSTGFVAGFGIPVNEEGEWHRHLGHTLLGSPDYDPADGIYLLGFRLWSDIQGISPSETFYFVYNNGKDEYEHDLAIEWVENNIVPEPATMVAFATGLAILASRRRRK